MKEENTLTDPRAILTMLDDAHEMQYQGKASSLAIHYYPDDGTLRVQLYDRRGERYAFCMSSAADIESNLEEFARLKHTWAINEQQYRQEQQQSK